MRKIIKIILPILVLLFVFSVVKVNADTPSVSTFDGAQIRTTDPAGLRFAGSVDEAFEGNAKYGFIASKGEYTAEEMITNFNNSCAVFIDCDGIDAENKYYLNIINIPASGYESDITVLACVDVDGVKTYAANSVTRNIKEVAEAAVSDPGYTTNEYIEKIVKTSTFVLNGGEFDTPSVEIGAFNAGSGGESGITLCTKGNVSSGSGQWWYRVFLKQTGSSSNVFTVVQTVEAGVKFDASTVDCDYVIAAHSNADIVNLKTLATKEYISIYGDYELAKSSDNYELLLGNKWLVKDGNTLPLATKQYFDFGGWYDNNSFEGDPITTKSGDSAETFYAKFSYTNYSIKYNLDGGLYDGVSSIANGSYTYATPTFSLPSSLLLTKEDYTFVEWNTKADGSGNTVTEVPVGTSGNLEFYAIWESDLPVEVELSAADSAAITTYNPTKFVKSDFTAGKFAIAGNTYKVGDGELFTNIASALSKASANDVIYVFGGTYSDDLTISTAGVKIVGPNQNKVGYSDSRVTEANIAAIITVGANNVELIGIQLSGTSKAITWTSAISNLTIKNVKSTASGKSTSGGRTAIIASDAGITNLVIDGLGLSCDNSTGRDAIAIYGVVNGFTVINSNITNGATSAAQTNEIIRINKISGVVDISNNTFIWATTNMSVYLGGTSNACTKMIFANNIIKGTSTGKCTTFSYRKIPSGCTVDIIGNWFEYFATTDSVLCFESVAGSTVNVKYNYFGTSVTFKNGYTDNGTLTYSKNYYVNSQTTTTADYGVITSLDDLIAAYEASPEYATYGSECVYSNWTSGDRINNTKLALDEQFGLITEISNDLTLPTQNSTYGTIISWSTNNVDGISNTGVYGKPYVDENVTLTATISYKGIEEEVSYNIVAKRYYSDLTDGISIGYMYFSNTTASDNTYEKLDVVIFAHANVSATGTLSNISTIGSYLPTRVTKAHNYGTYALLSIGITSSDQLTIMSSVAADSALRAALISNIVTAINTYNLDGVDIDWEFPQTSEKENFTLFMKELRSAVKANNKHHLVCAATGIDSYTRYDFANSAQYIDYICIMTYDMHSSSKATHQSALNYKSGYCYKAISNAYTYYVTNSGIDPSKLILGIPFYGRKFTNTDGLSQNATHSGAVTYDSIVSTYLEDPNYTEYWDDTCKVPYLYSETDRTFITYDNPDSIAIKAKYAKDSGFAGLMYWQDAQDSGDTLFNALIKGIDDNY